jgi:3D (Asp-Asp-Asp) domain-containing protein
MLKRIFQIAILFLSISVITGCNNEDKNFEWKTITVTATAYNSVASQTENHPEVGAWGDTLKPDMKVIAVSRDLVKMGLVYDTPVKIEGMEGTYLIKDKMHGRWTNRIDIFMGKDINKAKEWGRQKVVIHYRVPKNTEKE